MKNILLQKYNATTVITLNRPEKFNAFFDTMREDLVACLSDPEPRVYILTGAGRAFCAGGDIDVMMELKRTGDREGFRALLEAGRRVVTSTTPMIT